jgi:hypothetical protein
MSRRNRLAEHLTGGAGAVESPGSVGDLKAAMRRYGDAQEPGWVRAVVLVRLADGSTSEFVIHADGAVTRPAALS